MLSAALFDFDGTLIDTTELIHQSMRHAAKEVLDRDFPRETLLANVGQPLPRQMELLIGDENAAGDRFAREMLETYRVHNEAHHDALIEEFPNVAESLARLKGAGISIAVVTSKRRFSVDMALATFPALGEVVDHFVAMEDTAEHKPHPAPIFKGMELLGNVPPEDAAYVGDSPFDMAAAKAAGVTSVAVSWGAFTEDALRAAEPDHLVPNLDVAVDILLSLKAGGAKPDSNS
ncbi:MAG: HAD hydrolase-like protein [Actinomycetota bacterium]|jgi:pyrophosphatase PpaX|nr:HAD hydrolase-like protein [Rubrobacter sp.]MBA3790169.1 HAD hydrolase-like protein [Rubrobacter sp.]MDQ3568685.1 HAD hydrolase-like protein [Actinomycetota bacterium]